MDNVIQISENGSVPTMHTLKPVTISRICAHCLEAIRPHESYVMGKAERWLNELHKIEFHYHFDKPECLAASKKQ